MKVQQRQRGDVTVLEVSGKITIGKGDVAVRDAVQTALSAGHRRLVLDLGGVTAMDSAGVGELVSAYTTVSNQGGELKLASLPPKVSDLLQITQLITVFDVHDDAEAAASSF